MALRDRFEISSRKYGVEDYEPTRLEALEHLNRLIAKEPEYGMTFTVYDRLAHYGAAEEWDKDGNVLSVRKRDEK